MKELTIRVFTEDKWFFVETTDGQVQAYGSDLYSALEAFAGVYCAQVLLDTDRGKPTVWSPDELGVHWADTGCDD